MQSAQLLIPEPAALPAPVAPPSLSAVAPVVPGTGALLFVDPRMSASETLRQLLTEPSREQPALTLVTPIPEQYADSGVISSFTIPQDAFVHSNPIEILTLSATLTDGRPLPNWIHFDPNAGTFEAEVPRAFTGDIQIKVTARDTKGNEVSSVFRFNVGKKIESSKLPSGRSSLSEQLKMTGRNGSSTLRLADVQLAGRSDVQVKKVAPV